MSFLRLLLRSLRFHWRGNLAVGLGVAVGTAVLTGALLVGDSLRGTLRDLTISRLGWVDFSLVTGRFFTEERAAPSQYSGAKRVAPAILLRGSASRGDEGRVNNVVILGVDDHFWEADPPLGAEYWKPGDLIDLTSRSVVLGGPLARELRAAPGDTVTLRFEKASAAPRESLLGKRQAEDVLAALDLRVAAVLPDDHPGSAFGLSPAPEAPRNAYLPLAVLQDELRSQVRRARTLPERPINAILIQGGDKAQFDAALARGLTLADWGLMLREPRGPGARGLEYLSLESRQTFLPPGVPSAVRGARLRGGPTLVYLVNNLATAEQHALAAAAALAPPAVLPLPQALAAYYGPVQVPYSVVAALDPSQPPPLGPFLPPDRKDLRDDEILLVDWNDSPLRDVRPGAPVVVTYFDPGNEGRLEERSVVLKLAGVAPLTGPFRDRNLTPEFPGVTDVATMADWKEQAPFPFDESRLKPGDHRYWTEHRATPKAYVTLKTGQKLWGGRIGDLTSVRVASPRGEKAAAEVETAVLRGLDPRQGGFVFDDARAARLEASQSGMDFGLLFLGFSFFLIAAALLLVGLLFRLSIDRRAAEVGLLLAVGLRARAVRRLLVAEGALVAALGGLVGLAAAVAYTWLTLRSLGANWPAGLGEDFFGLHVTPTSLGIGYVASLAVSGLTIAWAARGLGKVSPRALLLGETEENAPPGPVRLRWSRWLVAGGVVGAAGCFVAGTQARGHEAQAFSFFGSGALLLTAGLALLWALLRRQAGADSAAAPATGVGRLAIRNAARNPARSLLTAGLLASASFVVVAVTAFHRDPGRDFLQRDGGSGGFALLAESDIPIYQDLNTPKGLLEAGIPEEDVPRLAGVTVVPLRVRAGDDASCLNLFQPRRPRVVGVPASLIQRGGFQFDATEAATVEERANPWLLLEKRRDDGAVPVFGEANTVTWMLKNRLGGELTVPDAQGNPVRLRIVGLLKDSVFQGELLTSDGHFLALYPRQEGYQMLLIDPGPGGAVEVRRTLEKALADRGLTVSEAVRRLETYLAVENTYLATFQGLGRLGLLLGVLGLAVVLLRSVWERRSELALLRALGLRNATLGRLILAENALLLVAGLGVGLAAGLLSVAPHLLGGAGEGLLVRLIGFLAAVAAVGLIAGVLAVYSTLRAPLIPALRRE